jgi:hypothetical protein
MPTISNDPVITDASEADSQFHGTESHALSSACAGAVRTPEHIDDSGLARDDRRRAREETSADATFMGLISIRWQQSILRHITFPRFQEPLKLWPVRQSP